MKRDCYEILGISESATMEEIKSAYRRCALKWHPDRNTANKTEAVDRFRECSEAFAILSDARSRRIYDTHGHQGLVDAGVKPDFRREVLESIQSLELFLRGASR